MMNYNLFIVGLVHSVLVSQGKNWSKKIRPELRFVLHWLSGIYALLIGSLFLQLPEGSVIFLINNLHEPLSVFLLFVLAIFSMAGAFATHISIKLRNSL